MPNHCYNTLGEEAEEINESPPIDYENLFEIWADFDDAETPDEVARLVETRSLGPVDAVSFTAFCYGYECALEQIRKALKTGGNHVRKNGPFGKGTLGGNMHFHPKLLVKADNLEEAKIIAKDFCDCECGEHSYFDYGDIMPDEKTEWNKPLTEVKDKLPADNHRELAMKYIEEANAKLKEQNQEQAGYYFCKAGLLLQQFFCIDFPLFNVQHNDYSQDGGEGWYAIEADMHC